MDLGRGAPLDFVEGAVGHVRCLPCGHFGRPHLLEAPVEVGVGHGEEVPLKVLVMAARHQLFEEMLGGVRVVAVRDEAPEGADEGVDALPRELEAAMEIEGGFQVGHPWLELLLDGSAVVVVGEGVP